MNYPGNDAEQNKIYGILAYIGILWLVPLLAAKGSPFARFHAAQGITLFIVGVVCSIAGAILGVIPFIGGILQGVFMGAVSIGCLILMIIGIIGAAEGKTNKLPIIGEYTLIK